MTDILRNNFISYVKAANNIYDIMAAACKTLYPFEPQIRLIIDENLNRIVSYYSEQNNRIQAFFDLQVSLIEWTDQHKGVDRIEFRKKMFYLVRLIDIKCVKDSKPLIPDPYIQYFSLNKLFQDEIAILPKYKSNAIERLSTSIAQIETEQKKGKIAKGHGFFGNKYDSTVGISGYLHNFIVYNRLSLKPQIITLNYDKEIRNEFEQNGYKLKVCVFPLSSVNLRRIFLLKEDITEADGVFSIGSCDIEQETLLFERCKEALEICRNQCVDIAVFPEMLFTKKIQDAIIDFVHSNQEEEKRFPWFTWLGTAWADGENKCVVIDQYGQKVFEQKKHIPYAYKRKGTAQDKISIVENLSHDQEWIVNFLDIPDFFRIATAICRDISDDILRDSVKKLHTDIVVIPAFSKTNRLTYRYVTPLVMEKTIVLVCNACSPLCEDTQKRFTIDKKKMGKEHTFCYLCMPAKGKDDNAADYYPAKYNSECIRCEKCCNGYMWEISFDKCINKNTLYTAEVT